MGDEVIAVRELARVAHKTVTAILVLGKQPEFLHHFCRGIQFKKASRVAFAHERVSVWKPLTGVHFAFCLVLELHLLVASHFLYAVAGGEQEISIWEHPRIVAARRRVFPFNSSVGG